VFILCVDLNRTNYTTYSTVCSYFRNKSDRMKEITSLLRRDVERAIGFKLKSTTEAKVFHQLVTEKTNSSLSLSTIRRFWGLIPEKKANQNTLNELAKFLQFKSFLDYSKHKNRYASWFDEIAIQKLKFKSRLTKEDFKLIEKQYADYGSNLFVMNLIEYAIFNEKWQYVFDLMHPKKLALLEDKQGITDYTTKLANLVVLFLNSLTKTRFDFAIEHLIGDENFKKYCIYIYVDVINLNKNYGEILTKISAKAHNQQEKLFIELISALGIYYKTNKAPKITKYTIDLDSLPAVLYGRYFGYQILYSSNQNDSNAELTYWNTFLEKLNNTTYHRDYLHEFVHHLLAAKQFAKLEHILVTFHDEIFENFHVHSYLDGFIFNLIDALISFKKNEKQRAKTIFTHLEIDKITNESYGDYYLIFYTIVGFHLHPKKVLQLHYQRNYDTITKQAGFNIFNSNYLNHFFD
jgi:hypothetical protein